MRSEAVQQQEQRAPGAVGGARRPEHGVAVDDLVHGMVLLPSGDLVPESTTANASMVQGGIRPAEAASTLGCRMAAMSVRTPDPDPDWTPDEPPRQSGNPGWLSDIELAEVRGRLPLLYVEAVPVRVDGLGQVTEVGALLRANSVGEITRTLVSGRVMYGETVRDALFRHLEKDLGPMAFPQLPASPVPFAVAEYFPLPGCRPSPTIASTPCRWPTSCRSPAPATPAGRARDHLDDSGGGICRFDRPGDGGRSRNPAATGSGLGGRAALRHPRPGRGDADRPALR